jgi:hypothetical protein
VPMLAQHSWKLSPRLILSTKQFHFCTNPVQEIRA